MESRGADAPATEEKLWDTGRVGLPDIEWDGARLRLAGGTKIWKRRQESAWILSTFTPAENKAY